MPVSIPLMGGLGNQLFQISTVLAYSLKYGIPYCIPDRIINPHESAKELYKFPKINYSSERIPHPYMYSEPFFHYQEIPKFESDNIILWGYFQSWKYFQEYLDEILKAFDFDTIQTNHQTCSIHLRLGDYKKFPDYHPIVTKKYIADAISNMRFNGYKTFIVFSDDIDESKSIVESFMWANELDFQYSEGRSALEDLRLMASCGSNILANSTFSWWGGYINPNPSKHVIAPCNWFGKAAKHSTKDLFPQNWTII